MRKALLSFAILLIHLSHLAGQDLSIQNDTNQRVFNGTLIYSNPKCDYEKQTIKAGVLLYAGKIDSSLNISSDLLQKAESGLLPPEQIVDAYTNMGRILLKLKVKVLAQWYLEKAQRKYLQFHFEPSRYSADMYSLLASNYISFYKKPEKAIDYYNKAQHIYKELKNHLFEASLINNIGYVYLENNLLDSAQVYFERAGAVLEGNKVPLNELMLSINSNLGDLAFRTRHFEKSFDYYELNYQMTLSNSDAPIRPNYRRVTSMLGMVKALFAMGKYEKSEKYLAEAEDNLELLASNDQTEQEIKIQILNQELYQHFNKIDAYARATEAKARLLEKQHKIEVESQSQVTAELVELQLASFNLKLDAQRKELQLAKTEKRLSVFFIIGLLVLSIVIGGFLILLVRRRTQQRNTQRKLLAANLQNQKLEEEKLQLELHNQSKDLNELSAHTLLLRKIAEEARERLKSIKSLSKQERDTELQSLSILFAREVNTNRAQALIQSNLQKVNASFFRALDESIKTHLSKKEKELCALFRLNLSDEQIAEIKLISVNAIQVARHRIKKKIGLEKQDDIAVFLSSINSNS